MRAGTQGRSRRLSGAHITLIVVALCVALSPAAVYAADRMLSVIADPYDASAIARVSDDRRLATRGDTTMQQGVPSNEWHTSRDEGWGLLRSAPPGSGIGLSQFTIENLNPQRAGTWAPTSPGPPSTRRAPPRQPQPPTSSRSARRT